MSSTVRTNDPALTPAERLDALRVALQGAPQVKPIATEVNNHIHTIYSFSPYSPTQAALRAAADGLCVAGSVDHDSIAAADEMLDACALLGLGGVAGFEIRVRFDETPFAGRKLNNPDSVGIAYMTVQGVARDAVPEADAFLAPVRARRRDRTAAMTVALNELLGAAGLRPLAFETDVLPLSKAAEGGGLTERHLLLACAEGLVGQFGAGPAVRRALERRLDIPAPPAIARLLDDPDNPHYRYDLLGLLKSTLLDRVFIQPDTGECLPVREAIAFARRIGAIPAYAYLGDVGESPTGDKKAEKFEDEFLDPLFDTLTGLGFLAVAYMPPRNTVGQLRRVQALCDRHGLMEISGVDINSSRQQFRCPELGRPEFAHLIDTTWALVAHQALVSTDRRQGLFAPASPLAAQALATRIDRYAALGRQLDLRHPEESAAAAFAAIGG